MLEEKSTRKQRAIQSDSVVLFRVAVTSASGC